MRWLNNLNLMKLKKITSGDIEDPSIFLLYYYTIINPFEKLKYFLFDKKNMRSTHRDKTQNFRATVILIW